MPDDLHVGQSEVAKRLTTFMMLGAMLREQEHPTNHELRLTRDGWEVRGGDLEKPLALSVDLAYEMSGYDQRVLDETRKLCGDLRFPAKKNKRLAEDLADLRAGLARARQMKAARNVSTTCMECLTTRKYRKALGQTTSGRSWHSRSPGVESPRTC